MEKIEKIYFYKMTADNGGAPCSYNSILTLAICKPKIRATAKEDDWMIGFGGKNLGEKLIYVAQVKEKIYNGEYYKSETYFKRPDCIYRWDSENKKYYWLDGKKYHKDGSDINHDLDNGKGLVLLSIKYVYFGNLGTSEYKEKYPEIRKKVKALTQGHRIHHSEELFNELSSLIKESIILEIEGKPTNQDNYTSCSNTEGEVLSCSRKTSKYV